MPPSFVSWNRISYDDHAFCCRCNYLHPYPPSSPRFSLSTNKALVATSLHFSQYFFSLWQTSCLYYLAESGWMELISTTSKDRHNLLNFLICEKWSKIERRRKWQIQLFRLQIIYFSYFARLDKKLCSDFVIKQMKIWIQGPI